MKLVKQEKPLHEFAPKYQRSQNNPMAVSIPTVITYRPVRAPGRGVGTGAGRGGGVKGGRGY